MEITLDAIDGLPETLKPLAAQADGKFKLDLAKLMPAEDLTGLKTALQRERENVGAYSKLGKPDEIAKRIADLEAAAAKGGKGGEEAQAKLDALKADYDGKLADRDSRLTALMKRQANAELRAELAKAGVIPEGLDILAKFAESRIQFNDDGTPKVTTPDGKPMIGSGPDHGATLADLAKELAKTIPHLVADGGKGGGGKLPNNGGTPQKTVTRAEFDAMSQADRAAFAKSGGTVTD
jgi:hypothetical protein